VTAGKLKSQIGHTIKDRAKFVLSLHTQKQTIVHLIKTQPLRLKENSL
jgi:hypothetical protein